MQYCIDSGISLCVSERIDCASLPYGLVETPWGRAVVAWSDRGVCAVGFCAGGREAAAWLAERFPGVTPVAADSAAVPRWVRDFFDGKAVGGAGCRVHLAGTPFQTDVWRALASIPAGTTVSYAEVAHAVGRQRAVRAVGSAVGANPVAVIIPCHRVIRADGSLGEYHWGAALKKAILAAEEVRTL